MLAKTPRSSTMSKTPPSGQKKRCSSSITPPAHSVFKKLRIDNMTLNDVAVPDSQSSTATLLPSALNPDDRSPQPTLAELRSFVDSSNSTLSALRKLERCVYLVATSSSRFTKRFAALSTVRALTLTAMVQNDQKIITSIHFDNLVSAVIAIRDNTAGVSLDGVTQGQVLGLLNGFAGRARTEALFSSAQADFFQSFADILIVNELALDESTCSKFLLTDHDHAKGFKRTKRMLSQKPEFVREFIEIEFPEVLSPPNERNLPLNDDTDSEDSLSDEEAPPRSSLTVSQFDTDDELFPLRKKASPRTPRKSPFFQPAKKAPGQLSHNK